MFSYRLRQAGALFLLGFSIVSGSAIFAPSHAHADIGPAPAKTMAMGLFHEVLVDDRAIEPEIVATTNLGPFARVQNMHAGEPLTDEVLRIGIKNAVMGKFVQMLVGGFVGPRVSNCPSVYDFLGEGFFGPAIGDLHKINVTTLGSSCPVKRLPMAQRIDFDSDYRQFERDSGSSTEIGRIGSGTSNGYLTFTSAIEKNSRPPETNSRDRENEREKRDRVGSRLLPEGFTILCLAAFF